MPPTLEALGIDKLSVPDRISLAQEIWDSIAAPVPLIPLTEAQQHELARRLHAQDADPSAVAPWEQVKAEALIRLQT